MKKNLLILLATLLCFSSCKKNAAKQNPDYIGYWVEKGWGGDACYMTLEIKDSGDASYFTISTVSDCRHFKNYKGTAKVNKDNTKMKVGSRHFDINMKPTSTDTIQIEYDGGGWGVTGKSVMKMVLDNDTLYKIIGK